MKTIPELEKEFDKAVGYKYNLFGGTEYGGRMIRGKHITIYIPLEGVTAARKNKDYFLELVERYYGKVKRTVLENGTVSGWPMGDKPHREMIFEFEE